MRWWRLALIILASLLAAAAITGLTVTVNVATGGSAKWLPIIARHPLRWMATATAIAAASSLLVWWLQRWYEQGSRKQLVPAVQLPEPWVVQRPTEVNQVVDALQRGGTVGITTAVHGAGGFGKTTIAKMVGADQRVLRHFGNRVYWITVGRDAGQQTLTRLIVDLITRIQPGNPVAFTSLQQAAHHLAAVLDSGPARLLIVDDVWSEEQLSAFPVGSICARLITTRNPSLVTNESVPVQVDQMSDDQAHTLLTAGLPPIAPAVSRALVEETGRWPLLLRLANRFLFDQARLEPDITSAAVELLTQLRMSGALQIDKLAGAAGQEFNVSDPESRKLAIRATILASTSLLASSEFDRLAELAVFAEDEFLPVALVGSLWHTTGSLDHLAAKALCARLADLALLSLIPSDDGGAVTMHDVIRDFLRAELGHPRLEQMHSILLASAAQDLPDACTLTVNANSKTTVAWWEMSDQPRYLWDHLVEHLIAARQADQAERLATDLRWVIARLQRTGPTAPYSDLASIDTPLARRLARVLAQTAHLLVQTDPPYSLADVLYSRVSHDPEWRIQIQILMNSRDVSRLINDWPLPDLPDPALRRTLASPGGMTAAVAIAPDGKWLAGGNGSGSVNIWDPHAGHQLAQFEASFDRHEPFRRRHLIRRSRNKAFEKHKINQIVIAPDGTWLATLTDFTKHVCIWDSATRCLRSEFAHKNLVRSIAISPDGSWLATVCNDGAIYIWDIDTGQSRFLTYTHFAVFLAVAPDGTWLACVCDGLKNKHIAILNAKTGERRSLMGEGNIVKSIAIAPDGSWLASVSFDEVVIWDVTTGQRRAVLTDHNMRTEAVAIAPDGSWLAAVGMSDKVHIWEVATGQQRAVLTSSTQHVYAVAIAPDSTWFATSGAGGLYGAATGSSVRIWDSISNPRENAGPAIDRETYDVAIALDGSWLASAHRDKSVRVWNAETGIEQAVLIGHTLEVQAVAIAPNGSWLASTGRDQTVRIWDIATGLQRATFTGHKRTVNAVVIAPDSSWLASAGEDGAFIWDTETGDQRMRLNAPGLLQSLAVSPDGSWLAGGDSHGWVLVWDSATGQQRAALKTDYYWVHAVAVSPDGAWLASGGSTRRNGASPIEIWDTATGKLRVTLIGHARSISAVSVTPDGTWLASVGHDNTIRIWDTRTWQSCAMMKIEEALNSCTWSPCGKFIIVAGRAGIYRFQFNS